MAGGGRLATKVCRPQSKIMLAKYHLLVQSYTLPAVTFSMHDPRDRLLNLYEINGASIYPQAFAMCGLPVIKLLSGSEGCYGQLVFNMVP